MKNKLTGLILVCGLWSAACSGEPEPVIIAQRGPPPPQAELERLDSVEAPEPEPEPEVSPTEERGAAPTATTGTEAVPRAEAPKPRAPKPRAPKPPAPQPEAPSRQPPVPEPTPPAPEPTPAPEAPPARPDTQPTPLADTVVSDTSASPPTSTVAEPFDTLLPNTAPPAPAASRPEGASDLAGVVPAGSQIHAALTDSLNSRRDTAGTIVTAKIMQHVTDPAGNIFIPAGAIVQLTVTRLDPAESRSAEDGKLALRVDGIRVGEEVRPINAEVQGVPHELEGRGVGGSEAAKVAGGAAVGAAAGQVITKKKKGTVIGGVVGAAAGAVIAAQTADRDIVVRARTPIVLVLKSPLVAAKNGY